MFSAICKLYYLFVFTKVVNVYRVSYIKKKYFFNIIRYIIIIRIIFYRKLFKSPPHPPEIRHVYALCAGISQFERNCNVCAYYIRK